MMVKKLLGDLVKEERLRRNLSQNSLAEQVHISLRTISDIENYTANPHLDTLCSLVRYLNISLDSILLKNVTPMDISSYYLFLITTIHFILHWKYQCSRSLLHRTPHIHRQARLSHRNPMLFHLLNLL